MFTLVFVINIKIRKMKRSEFFSVLGLFAKNIYLIYEYITQTGSGFFSDVDRLTIVSLDIGLNQQRKLQPLNYIHKLYYVFSLQSENPLPIKPTPDKLALMS